MVAFSLTPGTDWTFRLFIEVALRDVLWKHLSMRSLLFLPRGLSQLSTALIERAGRAFKV